MAFSVLFVDDDPATLKLFRGVFQGFRPDWDTRFAASGTEAVSRLATFAADVLVTDLQMPGLSGATLLEKAEKEFPRTKRVLITGSAGTCPHADLVLNKPCGPAALLAALDQIFLQNLSGS